MRARSVGGEGEDGRVGGGGGKGGLVTITPPSGSLTGESLAAFFGGN